MAASSSTKLAPGATCTIDVTFTPTAEGAQKGKLTVADTAPDSPQKISLKGTGSESPEP